MGPLSVTRDGARVPIGSGRQRSLLAALLVDAGQVVSVDALVGRLWGETRRTERATPSRTTCCGSAAPWGRTSW
ncbi:hypothetical protein [Actinomadura sp. CNU-125]|uniref:AfsR/SARP family transcriptional regulator n=1 Tax=Actinomadura sp. CNU-125 TaxID=1904961 RepID=UPI0021CC8267|nr:hypothetical protein [Actinomadura sp. CNU-125]